ncbi:MAG: phosphatase PAP2 family protein [Patescibacteria group bacterium]
MDFLIFLKKYFNKTYFSLFSIFFVSCVLIVFYLDKIIKNTGVYNSIEFFDIKINNFLLLFRTPELTKFFLFITSFGDFFVIAIFVVILILIFWFKNWRSYIMPLILAIVGSDFFVFLMKLFFHRQRPSFAVYQGTSFSFPSGHAVISMVFYGFLTYVFLKNIKKIYYKISIFFVGLFIILIVGFSRLYLGVHYFSDVFVGYFIGILWLIFSISLLNAYIIESKNKKNSI